MTMIIARHLTKRYDQTAALDDVSFVIEAGEAVALWGANGAGKTTTLRCLLGVQGFEGELTVNSIQVSQNGKAARAAIGYVPQEATFYDMTVLETLHFYARLKKVLPQRVPAVLDQVQLAEHNSKRVNMLSGGMKQRLALAVALLADPPVLVLDEPTANLDVKAQRDFIHTVQTLNQAGKTIVFSSHRLDEVIALGSRVLVLAEGKLILECLPHELADKLGLHRWLRIWVPEQHKDDTLKVLGEQGYTYMPNGRSVYVQVNLGGKIAPLRSLERASIPVEDFDLIDGDVVLQGDSHD
ncbi:MAG: ABC transporter ATP-binding protein [Anaerolineae bacterium]|nr:ABC transporter ATP-binding protein [Anaerolineae bacterium]